MDIVDRLRQRIGLVKFDSDAIALHDAADTIEQLRGQVDFERECREEAYADLEKQDAEIKRLREQCDRMASLAIDNAKDTERAMRLQEALREIYEVYAGSEGIPQPMTAAEGYLLSLLMEVVRIAQEALKEKE
jgi:hypothetical protein